MVETFHKTCNVKHEIDIKRYGNAKSETDSCQCFCFGLSFRFLFLFFLKIDGWLPSISGRPHFPNGQAENLL